MKKKSSLHQQKTNAMKSLKRKEPIKEARRTRVNIYAYQDAIAKRDLKLLSWVTEGYEIIHLNMNYDGITSKGLCEMGFVYANRIIDRCESMMPAA